MYRMKIWITRHGQTRLNKLRLMQGLTDEPLNITGIMQAKEARKRIGDVHFDAVYASPLDRAIKTGAYIGGVKPSEVIIDERLTETDFGKYEKRKYYHNPYLSISVCDCHYLWFYCFANTFRQFFVQRSVDVCALYCCFSYRWRICVWFIN